jgi:hypothetical protein
MNQILKRDPVWLGSLPAPDVSTTLVLIGGDGHQVSVPAPLLLIAVSPLVRNILTDLLPPAYCPCFLSLPTSGEVLQIVRDILTTGTVAGDHVEEVEEVRQVLGMLGVEAMIVNYQLESIQVSQVLGRDIKEEVSTEGPDISLGDEKVKMEVIVKIEDKENTNIEADHGSDTFGHSLKPKNVATKSSLNLKSHYNSDPNQIKIFCTLCSEKVASRSLLNRHVEFVHRIEISCKKVTHIKSIHNNNNNNWSYFPSDKIHQ